MSKKKLKVEICMGSSCFSRGNKLILPILQTMVNNNEVNAELVLTGSLCSENCSKGPVLFVNDKMYDRVHPDSVKDLLLHLADGAGNE